MAPSEEAERLVLADRMEKLPRPAAALFARFALLSDRDQLVGYEAIRDYLRAGRHPVKADVELDERAKAVTLIAKTVTFYGLDDPRKLEVKKFDEAPSQIRDGWKSGRVIRAWGRWRFAREAAAGELARPTARQHAIRSAAGARGLRTEDYLTALRRWLATNPPKETTSDYDDWRLEERIRRPGELAYPGYQACRYGLGLGWKEMLAVARGEIRVDQAKKDRRRSRPSFAHSEHQLVSTIEIVALTGQSYYLVQQSAARPDFPEPVLVFDNRRMWLKEDVEAFMAGRPVSKRSRNELAGVYVNSRQAAELLGVGAGTVWGSRSLLEPVAQVGGQLLWLRKDVEALRDERKRLGVKRGWHPAKS